MVFDVAQMSQLTAILLLKKQRLFSCKIRSLSLSFRHFGVRRVNTKRNNRLLGGYMLNKRAKFGAKYSCISEKLRFLCRGVLTHPVVTLACYGAL